MADAHSQTSINEDVPTEATFRFGQFTPFGSTAYQRGQEAGFSYAEARRMELRGAGRIVNTLDHERETEARIEREVQARVKRETMPQVTK